VDIATLGLRLDAQGFIQQAGQAEASLDRLGVASGTVTNRVAAVATTHEAAGAAAGRHALNINRLERVMESFTARIFGVNEVLGVGAAALSNFAAGSLITVGALAGLAIIAAAFEKLTEHTRKAKEEFEKYLKLLDELKRKQELGPAGEAGAATRAGQGRLGEIGGKLSTINERIAAATGAGAWSYAASLEKERTKLIAEYVKLQALVKAGETEVTKIFAEEDKKRTEKEKQEAAERARLRDKQFAEETERERAAGRIRSALALLRAKELEEEADLTDKLRNVAGKDAAREQHAAAEQQKTDLDEILFRLRQELDLMDDQTAKAKRIRELAAGGVLGTMGGIFQGIGGPLGGAASGAIAGIPGGPMGVAVGAFSGLMSSLLGSSGAAQAAREQMRQLQNQTDSLSDSLKVMRGEMQPIEARLAAVRREFIDLRNGINAEDVAQYIENLKHAGVSTKELEQKLLALNVQERLRVQIILEEVAALNKVMQEDLNVRALRAQGLTEEADNLAFVLGQERELADARKAGASEATLAWMEEVQKMEAVARAMAKIQQRIDSLNATIEGLQTFKNTLLLSAVQSPAAVYAEAKRQYDEIAGKAMAGDQAAAGKLPGAAQTFLDASRAVNASGAGFQSDFLKVLSDTQAAIDKFGDLKSIEELQLDELKKIQASLQIFHDGWEQILTGAGTVPTVDNMQASVTVQQEGFQQVVQQLNELNAKVEANTDQLRRSFDGMAANARNN
jgi:hypothetical protein